MAGSIVLMDALVADSIDYDRIRVPRAREGLYFGVWRMSTKAARALGLLLAVVTLLVIQAGSPDDAGISRPARLTTLAIVPFAPDNDSDRFLVDGMTASLLSGLSKPAAGGWPAASGGPSGPHCGWHADLRGTV